MTVSSLETGQPRCPLTDEWMKKVWYRHTKQSCSGTKKEMMSSAGEETSLEILMLSRVSQTQEDDTMDCLLHKI